MSGNIGRKIVEHKWLLFLAVVIALAALSLVTAYRLSETQPAKYSENIWPPVPSQGMKIPNDFSLDDKIGQLLIVGVSSRQTAIDMEAKYQIGGFLLRPDTDLFSKNSTEAIKKAGEIAPLFAVDEEGGQISRLPNADFSEFSARYMGTLSDSRVKDVGYHMALAIRSIGANLDFAPVVDLDDGNNAAISQLDRSYSANPTIVAEKAQAFAAGLDKGGVIPTFKHFPGLGNAFGPTSGNTDTGPATTPDIASLEKNDLLPYRTLLRSGAVNTVMVGNQVVPGLSDGLPASLSGNVYKLLREDYGYNQIIFTDELVLAKAVASVEPNPAASVVAAIQAGTDMPLIDTDDPATLDSIITSVASAVKSGQIKESRIDASLSRIMRLKTSIK